MIERAEIPRSYLLATAFFTASRIISPVLVGTLTYGDWDPQTLNTTSQGLVPNCEGIASETYSQRRKGYTMNLCCSMAAYNDDATLEKLTRMPMACATMAVLRTSTKV